MDPLSTVVTVSNSEDLFTRTYTYKRSWGISSISLVLCYLCTTILFALVFSKVLAALPPEDSSITAQQAIRDALIPPFVQPHHTHESYQLFQIPLGVILCLLLVSSALLSWYSWCYIASASLILDFKRSMVIYTSKNLFNVPHTTQSIPFDHAIVYIHDVIGLCSVKYCLFVSSDHIKKQRLSQPVATPQTQDPNIIPIFDFAALRYSQLAAIYADVMHHLHRNK